MFVFFWFRTRDEDCSFRTGLEEGNVREEGNVGEEVIGYVGLVEETMQRDAEEETVAPNQEEKTIATDHEEEAMASGHNSSVEGDDCEVIVKDMAGYRESELVLQLNDSEYVDVPIHEDDLFREAA